MIKTRNIIPIDKIEDIKDEFMRFDVTTTGLPVDVFCDESDIKSFTFYPNMIFFRNSYYKDSRDYMPVLVSDNPILLSDKKLNIFKKDCYQIFEWIVKYRDIIIALSEEKIDNVRFLQYLGKLRSKKHGWDDTILESVSYTKYQIYEMAHLHPSWSGLKYTLWLDDDMLYKRGGHSYRIKIQSSNGNKSSRGWNELALTGEWIGNSADDYSAKERKSIVKFMNDNMQLIKDLSDKKISFAYFKEHLIKFSSKKIEDEIVQEIDDDYKIVYSFDNGFDMVINDSYHYNVIDENGEILSDEWFVYIDFKTMRDSNGVYFICTSVNEKKYKLYTDKKIYKVS